MNLKISLILTVSLLCLGILSHAQKALDVPPPNSNDNQGTEKPVVRVDVTGDDRFVEQTIDSPPSIHLDDANVPEPGWVEANMTVNSVKTGAREVQVPLIDVNVGYVMPALKIKCELKAEIPPATIETDDQGKTTRIVGDSSIGSKCLVYDNEGRRLSFAVYPEYDWSENGTIKHFRIPLLGTKEWDELALTANVGYNKGVGTANTFWDGGFGVGHRLSDRNAILAGGYFDGEDNTKWVEIGFRRKFGNDNLNIGVGRTVGGTPYAGGAPGKSFSIGWQHNWKAFKWTGEPAR